MGINRIRCQHSMNLTKVGLRFWKFANKCGSKCYQWCYSWVRSEARPDAWSWLKRIKAIEGKTFGPFGEKRFSKVLKRDSLGPLSVCQQMSGWEKIVSFFLTDVLNVLLNEELSTHSVPNWIVLSSLRVCIKVVSPQHVQSASWTSLLPLEPRP